jgi:SNF2 family DNA or RNA helicase
VAIGLEFDAVHACLWLKVPWNEKANIEIVKALPGREWSTTEGCWRVPIAPATAPRVCAFVRSLGYADDEIHALLRERQSARRESYRQSFLKEASRVIRVPGLLKTLRPYQEAGVGFASSRQGTLLADDMGLGKTLQAIATVELEKLFPCLVIAPAVAVWNWVQEILQATGKMAGVPDSGKKAPVAGAQYIVCSASSLHKVPSNTRFAVVIADESHLFKIEDSLRTRQAQHLVESDRPDLRLALTGTPYSTARPIELVPQLALIGALDAFGGRWPFIERYCAPRKTPFGMDLNGAANLSELGVKLREVCMIRRLRKDVLGELPPLQVSQVPVRMTNVAEYRRAEKDFKAWYADKLKSRPDLVAFPNEDPRSWSEKYLMARVLLKIEKMGEDLEELGFGQLRWLTGKGKIAAALAWVDDFMLGAPGTPLVVFAHSRDVQAEILARYKDLPGFAAVLGSTLPFDRAAIVAEFQAGRKDFLLASLQAANTAITLTRAAHMLFAEIDHIPSTIDQALARSHRMGQERPVNAYMLFAADGLDPVMQAMQDTRRRAFAETFDAEQEFV